MARPQRRHLSLTLGLAAALGVSLLSCQGDRLAGPGGGPQFAISDAVHSSGNPHFYFRPPLVPATTYTGTSDSTQSPTVVVCEWVAPSCGAVVAQFSRDDSGGAEAIRYDSGGQQYVVNWHTDQCVDGPCTLDPVKTYRLRVLVGAVELGFADVDVVSNGSQLRNVQTDEYIGLVNGRTLPVKFRIEEGAVAVLPAGGSAVVGSSGASLATADGLVALEVPGGALEAPTTINVGLATDAPEGTGPWAAPVELGPDGTTFSAPVTLTLGFDATRLPEGVPPGAVAMYTQVEDGWEEVPGGVVNATDNTVSAPISHFSTYAILIRPNSVSGTPSPTSLFVGQSTTFTGWSWAYVSYPARYCYTIRVWVSRWWGGYWTYRTYCYTTVNTYSYYPTGQRVYWVSGAPAVAAVGAPGYSMVASNGSTTSPPIQALAVGSTDVTASIGGVRSSPVTLTVLPSLSLFVAGDPFSGPRSDTYRETGIGQAFPLIISTPAAVAANLTVTISHTNPGVTSTPGSAVITAGTASRGIGVIGAAPGYDTLTVTAPGYGPDTVVVRVGTGRTLVEGWPATLAYGDSAALRVRPVNPPYTIVDNAYNTTFALTSSPNLEFRSGGVPITSIRVPDGTSATAVFYVKAVGVAAAGTASVTHPNYVPTDLTVTIEAPVCVAPPAGLAHWWPGENGPQDIVGGDHGSVVGSVSYAAGMVGRAFQFGSGYLRLAGPYGGAGTSEVTVMAWIRTQATGPAPWQAVLSSTTSSYLHLQSSTFGGAALYTDPGSIGFTELPSFAPTPLDTWRHVALTARSGDVRIYEDGRLVTQRTTGYTYITRADDAVLIGNGYQYGRPFPGLVDEVQVYDRALGAAEVQQIAGAGPGGVCAPAGPPPAPSFSLSDLGTLGGSGTSEALAINGSGFIVGVSNERGFYMHATATAPSQVPNPFGDIWWAYDVNAGNVVAATQPYAGYLWNAGAGTITGPPPGPFTQNNRRMTFALNNTGLVLACADNGAFAQNYVWNTAANTATLIPGAYNWCYGRINDAGIAIVSADPGAGGTARLWDQNSQTATVIPSLGGVTIGRDLNADGVAVGSSQMGGRPHAFRYDRASGQTRDLGTLGGLESEARGINDAGIIVGWSLNAAGQKRGFIWDPTRQQMFELPVLPGHDEGQANDINAEGVIVGYSAAGGVRRAVRWTPQQ